MHAPEVSEDDAHRIHPATLRCYRCGMSLDVIEGLRLSVCSRILEIRERLNAIDRDSEEATDAGHADWRD